MLEQLLAIPERRNSIVPELIAFFAKHGGKTALHDFLKTFAGAKFVCPGPEFLAGLRNDELIVRSLTADSSIENRVWCLTEYKVTYTHIQVVYQAVTGRSLDSPHPTDGRTTIGEAARWIRKNPRLDTDIMTMFGINARQHVDVMGLVQAMRHQRTHDPYAVRADAKRKDKRPPMTENQEMLLAELRSKRMLTLDDMRGTFGTVPTKTAKVLVELGLATRLRDGTIKITQAGAA